jgi:hypothetical protein
VSIRALGRLFDLGVGFIPVDMQTAANTGKRQSLKHCAGVTIVLFKAVGTAGDDPVLTLKQHTASSSGTTANLAAITTYWYKASVSAAMANTEQWVEVTQAAAATISDPGGLGTSAESSMIVVVEVLAEQLADGYAYVSLDVADTGGNAQLGGVLYIPHGLKYPSAPANLPRALA